MSAQPLQMPSSLPKPTGYKILVEMYKAPEKTGLIYKPQEAKALEDVATIVARVIALGPDAYKDPARFSGPFCKPGDWVLFRTYSGTRMKVRDQEFRLINDDTVEAVVEDPTTVGMV